MALDSPKLKDVLGDVASGTLQLPDFQREWKWDDDRIRAIIATVTLDYPLGVVMTLETGGTSSPFRARTLTGADSEQDQVPHLLLLDGQQRLTSLFQALYLDAPVKTVGARGNPIERWYYVDIAKAVGASADRDEAIVSVPENKILRTEFTRGASLDLTTIERECEAGLFPLHFVFDIQRVNAWKRVFVKADDRNWDLWSDFEERVLEKIRSFQVPMIRLAASTSMDAVCAVFERVNTGGVPLNVFELLTATYAGDRSFAAESGDYYQLPVVWQTIKKALTERFPVFGRLDQGVEDGLSSSDFLQAVALVRTWERKLARPGSAVSCKRRDLLDLPLADFDRLAPKLADAFAWVGDFLQQQCIVRAADLPYRTQLVPLAAVRAILGAETDSLTAEEMITQWYWCGVLGEMYGGSTETRFTKDVEQLVGWIRRTGEVPDTVSDAYFFPDRLDTLTTRHSAAYKGIYALLIKQGAVDWHHTGTPISPARITEHWVDVRQIFPKAWAEKEFGRKFPAGSIVNKTPLSYRAAQGMSGPPATYLPSLITASDMRPEWFDDVIATHLIDPDALHANDYERFYLDRSKQLVELVQGAMGKRTALRGAADGGA
ncbi:DUF262 domain-containing protein [Kitasatospora sp. NPDC091257]|uniref:GmrSD restriction endonuclease domain-containing protein n=1 Tax=Kitasatospora sp. NPDC091257 TaxID=3364084 RepID=UPI003828AA7D